MLFNTIIVVVVWSGFQQTHHREVRNLVENGNAKKFGDYLNELFRKEISHGIYQGEWEYNLFQQNGEFFSHFGHQMLDYLVSLAEALGVISIENPQRSRSGENLYGIIDDLIDRIENALGIDIIIPDVASELFDLETGQTYYRLPHHRFHLHGLAHTKNTDRYGKSMCLRSRYGVWRRTFLVLSEALIKKKYRFPYLYRRGDLEKLRTTERSIGNSSE